MIKETILSFLPDLKELQEAALKNALGNVVGWHSNVLVRDGRIQGSGTHQDRAISRTVAISEAIERRVVEKLRSSGNAEQLLLDEYPTTCGFAVGFNRDATRGRALCEAIERWIRSKWIDYHFGIPEINESEFSAKMSPLGIHLRQAFTKMRFFQTTNTMVIDGQNVTFFSAIVVGFEKNGAFVGSRTSLSPDNLWTHAIVEAWRHLIIHERSPERDRPDLKSIFHFGEHQGEALKQIEAANQSPIPAPTLRILREIDTQAEGLFCFRALCRDFRGWHGDDYWRFVY
jgi:ribosomal protein S12 methylthiotransferase accessory factor YcaO